MKISDLPEVIDIRVSVKENAITLARLSALGITTESLANALNTDSKGWVYIESGTMLGFVMGDGVTGEVYVLAVLPGHEKKGIGAGLMNAAQQWLFSQGHQQLWLKTSPDPSFRAYGFYKKLGWQPTGELDGEDEKFVLLKDTVV